MTIRQKMEEVTRHADIGLELSVYEPATLDAIIAPLEQYLSQPAPQPARRGWFSRLLGSPEPERVAPLLLAGPVGTGKTTLMMLLDRALPQASCAALFQQEIAAHPTALTPEGERLLIEVHPLPLMGQTRNLSTGVIRLRELQSFHRRFTYDRQAAREDPEAAERFARLFGGHIVFVDEFVPDVVSSFPMQVINHLADHGVQVVLSSNRHETPFVEGVRVVPVRGADMRTGELGRVLLPQQPDPRFDGFAGVPPTALDRVARGLRGRFRSVGGKTWLLLEFDTVAHTAADWLAFQHLLQLADAVLVDNVPLFDAARGAGPDAARRFVFLIDAIYDERRPVLLRLTNPQPLADSFEVEQLSERYLPEVVVDLERALSRLRQLSALVEQGFAGGGEER